MRVSDSFDLEGDGGTDLRRVVPNLNIQVLSILYNFCIFCIFVWFAIYFVLEFTIKALKFDTYLDMELILPFELKVNSLMLFYFEIHFFEIGDAPCYIFQDKN